MDGQEMMIMEMVFNIRVHRSLVMVLARHIVMNIRIAMDMTSMIAGSI